MTDEQRFEHLEDKVSELEGKIGDNALAIAQFSVTQENVADAYQKLSSTLKTISDTMIALSVSFENTTKQITEMKQDISNINDNVNKLDKKVALVEQQTQRQEDRIEDNNVENKKNKIDMRDIVAKAIELAIFGGGIGLLIHYLG